MKIVGILGVLLFLFGGLVLIIGLIVCINTWTSDYATATCVRAEEGRKKFVEAKTLCGDVTSDCYKRATIGLTSADDCDGVHAEADANGSNSRNRRRPAGNSRLLHGNWRIFPRSEESSGDLDISDHSCCPTNFSLSMVRVRALRNFAPRHRPHDKLKFVGQPVWHFFSEGRIAPSTSNKSTHNL